MHLRQHAFPSPLLDWTYSPYIAAHFAFAAARKPVAGRAAIYVLSERPKGWKSDHSSKAQIRVIGKYVRAHRKHFLQQSNYTMCVDFGPEWRFAEHETVLSEKNPDQDLLWKFSIPYSERLKVLTLLDTFNLNEFSLFKTPESLMQTIALRVMDFGEEP